MRVQFDNTMNGPVLQKDAEATALEVWNCLQEEIRVAVQGNAQVNVALSGGWDSRHVLAGLHRSSGVRCLTYGNSNWTKPGLRAGARTPWMLRSNAFLSKVYIFHRERRSRKW